MAVVAVRALVALLALCGVSGRAQAQDEKQECLSAYAESQKYKLKGALLTARERLMVCSRSSCPAPVVKDCIGWLGDVDNSLSSVVFALSDPQGADVIDARVTANQQVVAQKTDGRAVELDPGLYTFEFQAPGYQREQQTIAIRQSEKNRIIRVRLTRPTPVIAQNVTATLQPVPLDSGTAHAGPATAGAPFPVVTTILGGVALAGVGTFAYLGARGMGKLHDAERCESNCRAIIDSGRRDYLIADIGLGVAIAAAVSATLVYFLAESSAPEPVEHAYRPQRQQARLLPQMAF